MTEQIEGACPRCGEAGAADYRLCPFCGLNLGSVSEGPTREWEAGDPSKQPAYEPLQPPASAWLSGPDSNGASEETVDEASVAAANEVDFDRGAPGDAASEATAETREGFEVAARAELQTADPSQQPGYEPLQPPASAWLSGPDSNGASEETVDDVSVAAAREVRSDRSPEEEISAETVSTEASRSDHGPAESADESALDSPAPLRDQTQPGGRLDGSLSVVADRATRSAGRQRVTLACLAAVIGLLVLVASRSLRGRG